MRKLFSLLLVLSLFLSVSVSAFAHSGKTDANGGHTDRSTGEYHYHHGYPAHQHYDMDGDGNPDCPYLFEDKTNHNSGSSASGTYASLPSYSPSPVQASSASLQASKDMQPVSPTVIKAFIVSAVVLVIYIWHCVSKRRRAKEEAARKQREHEEWLLKKAEYTKMYCGKTPLELSGAPAGCFVGKDGLPASMSGSEKWGANYTFYASSSGSAFHCPGCRYATNMRPVNAYVLRYLPPQGRLRRPCSVCHPVLPDMAWYKEYLRLQSLVKKYDLPVPPGHVRLQDMEPQDF